MALDSFLSKSGSIAEQHFLETVAQIREKRFHEFFEKCTVREKNIWEYNDLVFIYHPKMEIQELFNKNAYVNILKIIRKTLHSDSFNWVCFINKKAIYMFRLSLNHFLVWSPIITELAPYFLTSILQDSTVLNHVNDFSRWHSFEGLKNHLINFLKRLTKKNNHKIYNESPPVTKFILQIEGLLVAQKYLQKSINRKIGSFSSSKINNLREIQVFFSNLSHLFDVDLNKEISLKYKEIQMLKSVINNLERTDHSWLIDIHPLNFLEIMPQLSEDKYRKTGGFYTPIPLAESIVNHVFEKYFFEEKLTNPISDVKIFDPAMGPGILLIFALEWLTNYAISLKDEIYPKDTFIDYRREILFSCLHGSDIDEEAILIAKRFLQLFCMLKMENNPALSRLKQSNFIETFLRNINSNCVKFDLIFLNPPYIPFHSRFIKDSPLKNEIKSLKRLIPAFSGKRDNTYLMFLGISLQHFLASSGVLGIVIDHSFLDLPSYNKTRHFILSNYHLHYVLANYSYRGAAVVDLALLVISSQDDSNQYIFWQETLTDKLKKIPKEHFLSQPNYMFRFKENYPFFSRIQGKTVRLGKIATATCGLEYGSLLKTHFLSQNDGEGFYPCIDGANGLTKNYFLFWVPGFSNSYVRFDKKYEQYLTEKNQNISKTNKKVILISGSLDRFLEQKIILRQTAPEFIGTIDNTKFLTLRNTHLIYNPKPPYSLFLILGILTSSLGNFIGKHLNIIRTPGLNSNRYPQIRLSDLKEFPIIDINKLQDESDLHQLEKTVKEILLQGESVTQVLSQLWGVFQKTELKFTSQRHFLRTCF
ncbi:MAG: N-6 DNA methylase, partial [Candidatus Heimdallarchaeota archaeon]